MQRPDILSPQAFECWDWLVETCRAEGIRIEHRRDALIRYAETWAMWRECVDGIWSEGQVVSSVSPDGLREMRRNPRMVDQAQLSRLLYQCASELGLSAKARLEIVPGDGTEGTDGTDATAPERRVVYKIRA